MPVVLTAHVGPLGRLLEKSCEKKQEQEVQIDTGLRHTSHICAWLKDYVWLFCNNQAAQLGG